MIETFSTRTDVAEFQTIPLMSGEDITIGEVEDFGSKDYMVKVSGSTVSEYQEYLDTLEQEGFQKHSDNGEEAMEGYVYTAAYTQEQLTVVVSHTIKENTTYITASYNRPLSDHMIYKDEYMDGVDPEAKTRVHLFQMVNNGTGLIIQLKNGHFVIHDGGNWYDAPYFMDYMRTLVPEGKIVVEGWFISHPHADHYGVLNEMYNNRPDWAEQFAINGIYFHYPHEKMGDHTICSRFCYHECPNAFKDVYGNTTKTYRPQLGQRYYFCDTIVDICLTTEQIDPAVIKWDVNDTSFWCKTFIDGRDGQTLLINGDSAKGGHNRAMELYDEAYFAVDVYAVSHHGMNVYQNFVDYMSVNTLLYTCYREGSLYAAYMPDGRSLEGFAREPDNEALRNKAKEYYSHGLGTVVLTFPYGVGEAEVLEMCKWQYHNSIPLPRLQHPPYGVYEWGWRKWDKNYRPYY